MTHTYLPLHGLLSDLWIVPTNELNHSSLSQLEQAESKYNKKIEAIRNIDAKEPIGLEMHLKRGDMKQLHNTRISRTITPVNRNNVPPSSPIVVSGFQGRSDSNISPDRSMDHSQSSGTSY